MTMTNDSRPISVLVLPPHELWEPWTGRPPSGTEDRELPFRLLAGKGFNTRRIDLTSYPWNPFGRASPVFRAIDPLRALRILVALRKTDIVLCHFESSALVLILLRRLFLFKGKVAVRDVGTPGWRTRDWILGVVVPRSDALLPVGRNQAAGIRAAWHPTGLVETFPQTVDCEFFRFVEPNKAEGGVIAIGDDISRDYSTLLAVANALPVPVKIRTRLLQQETVTSANVEVISRFLSMAEYRDLIAQAEVIVLPLHSTMHAGGVTVLVQAMASGKAIVASASEGLADYLVAEENCLVVPCYDAEALLAAINRLLADPQLRARLGATARLDAVKRYSLPAYSAFLERVFGQLAPRATSPVPPRDEVAPLGSARLARP